MTKLSSPAQLVQPRGVSNTRARLDGMLDDIGSRPTVQPAAPVGACAGASAGAGAGARTGAHTSQEVGQVGRLDGNQPRYRDLMPRVWEELARRRKEFGDQHVAECIRRGMAGEPDWFYAFEGGYVVGTPFTADKHLAQWVLVAAAMGSRFGCVLRPGPTGGNASGT